MAAHWIHVPHGHAAIIFPVPTQEPEPTPEE